MNFIKTKFLDLAPGDKFVVLEIGEKFDKSRHRIKTKINEEWYTETEANGEIRRHHSVTVVFIDVHKLVNTA